MLSKEDVVIRAARREDLTHISTLFAEESSKKPYSQTWTAQTSLRKITSAFKDDHVHVILVTGTLAGFIISHAYADKKEAYIDELWLQSAVQGKGIGKMIMQFIENFYRTKGMHTVGLIANANADALHFYKKLQYRVTHDLVYMKKEL